MLVATESVTERYRRVVEPWPLEPRTAAMRLPFRLGLVSGEAGTWDDFSGVRIANDLPALVLPDVEPCSPPEAVEEYRSLHLCVCAAFLARDRVADGDVPGGADLDSTIARFDGCCVDRIRRLPEARDPSLLEGLRAEWDAAVALERSAIAAGSLPLREYGRIAGSKNRYLVFAACLHPRVGADPLLPLLLEGLVVALQCRSDAVDSDSDRARFGRSFPDMLGCSDALLHRASLVMLGTMRRWTASRGYALLSGAIDECTAGRLPGADPSAADAGSATMAALCAFPGLARFH